MRTSVTVILFAAGVALAQPSFEVAAVKPAPANLPVPQSCTGGPGSADPGRLTCSHASLAGLIVTAYDIQFYQLKSPDWMLMGGNAGGYDIVAKIPEGTTKEQYKLMLQNLLAERFHLQVHHEMLDYSQYSLVAGKGASKLARSQSDSGSLVPLLIGGNISLIARHISMKTLAGFLSTQVSSPVTDNTSLTGEYDFNLEFVPDPRWRGLIVTPSTADYTQTEQNLFSALQDQLGLKLETEKAPLDFLIVDHADKTPTEN